jgi:apolipoprotein D and lipocalin family protein
MSRRLLALAVISALALPASAAAPEPVKPLDVNRFMGRWYEILRTPNDRQKNCYAAYQVWSKRAADRFAIAQHCRKGSRTGPLEVVQTDARLLGHSSNAKFEASFFGGLIRKNYWVIDHADDYSWMIASSSDGKYPAVLARTPGLSPARQAELKRRMAQLGLPTGQLQAVGAP